MLRHAVRRLAAIADAAHGHTNKLLLTMGSPHEAIAVNKPIESLSVPGVEGTFTVSQNHSKIISRLQPGRLTVKEEGKEEHYFISDGFLFFNHPEDESGCCNVEVSGVEIVPEELLDKDAATQMMSELNSGSKDTDWDKARVGLGTDMLSQVMKYAH